LSARRAREHAGIDEFHEAPGARERQQRLDLCHAHLLVVKAVSLGQQLHRIQAHALGQVLVDVEEQRAVDVFLPGQEPVGRKRQLALGRGLACDFFVEADQALVGQRGFRLQHLHACAHLDQHGRALDLARFVEHALGARFGFCFDRCIGNGGGHGGVLLTKSL
jgi:hypothetical protein